MQLAWAASIVAQAWLAVSLLRAGRRDWWPLYVAMEAARSLLLFILVVVWPMHSHGYWYAWAITQLIVTYPGIRLIQQSSNASPSRFLGVGLAVGLLSWSIVLTHPNWPAYRRAGLMLHQCLAFGGFGVLCAAATDGIKRPDISAYFAVESLEVLAEQAARTRVWVEMVGMVYMVTLLALFSILILRERILFCRK